MAQPAKGKNKYGAMIAQFREPAPTEASVGEASPYPLLPAKEKPQGKRSDPAWKQYSILLKRESHKKAVLILRKKYDGTDVSDLMETLLEHWLTTEA
jgi:hypothetical protein